MAVTPTEAPMTMASPRTSAPSISVSLHSMQKARSCVLSLATRVAHRHSVPIARPHPHPHQLRRRHHTRTLVRRRPISWQLLIGARGRAPDPNHAKNRYACCLPHQETTREPLRPQGACSSILPTAFCHRSQQELGSAIRESPLPEDSAF
ncbi:hypothetical protein PUNSTDRAFT_122698 [Punctularia strigosozonata HHB-11173 SS5]|uniref:Uncharacterized protein n=1 Tax=Punctularia strigosozonata (strain HHB-11173) TaxID=741275 RepID=R7S461_PUNST|nr:uncharacterized protein PUNSTDRAFT_122698 [Punctularia strigosozonata HHB-11173 SS5]EIN04639.1 hypothetical protein PUNSTDRAFT_122698 [Punctularia strigosozonata HHB-11173 SS5]